MKYATMTDEEFERAEISDIHRDTSVRIEEAVFGFDGEHICYLQFENEKYENETRLNNALRDLEKALSDNNDRKSLIDTLTATFNAELQAVRAEAQKKIDHLLQEVANLWEENQRKSNMIDKLVDKK